MLTVKYERGLSLNLEGEKLVVIGGAGLIGSHVVDKLLAHDVDEIVIYDNFVRGREENLENALRDPRVRIYDVGGDIMQSDILKMHWRVLQAFFI